MQVSGIGAGMAGGGMGAVGGAGAAGNAGAPGGAGSAEGAAGAPSAGMDGMTPAMQELVETMKDFSSAEILMALMFMKAASQDDDEKGTSGAAMGFLAGMALAGYLNQSIQDVTSGFTDLMGSAGCGGGGAGAVSGVGLDVQA